MNEIDRELLSALIDGELPPGRAETVLNAINKDENLRREYEQLLALDGEMKAFADAAVFQPDVSLDQNQVVFQMNAPLMAVGLLVLRLVLKVLPPLASSGLEIAVLGLVIVWTVKYLVRYSDCETPIVILVNDKVEMPR